MLEGQLLVLAVAVQPLADNAPGLITEAMVGTNNNHNKDFSHKVPILLLEATAEDMAVDTAAQEAQEAMVVLKDMEDTANHRELTLHRDMADTHLNSSTYSNSPKRADLAEVPVWPWVLVPVC